MRSVCPERKHETLSRPGRKQPIPLRLRPQRPTPRRGPSRFRSCTRSGRPAIRSTGRTCAVRRDGSTNPASHSARWARHSGLAIHGQRHSSGSLARRYARLERSRRGGHGLARGPRRGGSRVAPRDNRKTTRRFLNLPEFCCNAMAAQVEFSCDRHPGPRACPDKLVDYLPKFNEYGLVIHDGGSSHLVIRYCPWCGADLEPTYRIA